jgi:hypothetical protein
VVIDCLYTSEILQQFVDLLLRAFVILYNDNTSGTCRQHHLTHYTVQSHAIRITLASRCYSRHLTTVEFSDPLLKRSTHPGCRSCMKTSEVHYQKSDRIAPVILSFLQNCIDVHRICAVRRDWYRALVERENSDCLRRAPVRHRAERGDVRNRAGWPKISKAFRLLTFVEQPTKFEFVINSDARGRGDRVVPSYDRFWHRSCASPQG